MNNRPSTPLVSIGMPVFNEEDHVDSALLALRAQSHANVEIIICDNGSTDNTLEICRRHASQDSRIRIFTAEQNIGVTANFRRALGLANGDYFMWASGHDLWSEDLVGDCVEALETRPAACLAFASNHWIDAQGDRLPNQTGWSDLRGLAPLARFFTVFWGSMNPVLGLFRTAALRETPLPSIVGGDLVLLCALSLRHEFLHVKRPTWCRRELRHESSYRERTTRYSSTEFGAARSRFARIAPLLQLSLALLGVVWRAPLGRMDKFGAMVALVPAMLIRRRVGVRSMSRQSGG